MEGNTDMTYVNLGRSGIKVSKLAYGNWVNSKEDGEAQTLANELLKTAWENGINYFDTAEGYDYGKGERQFGIALKGLNVPRSDYIVSTKIFFGSFPKNNNKHNNMGTSRKRLIEGLDRSLKNLGLEYVDVVFCHRYDEQTPTIEVVQTMKSIINSGKAFYWATSTWPPIRVMEAMLLCDSIGCPRPIAEQCQYNMLHRDEVEKDYVPLFNDYGLGTTIWSPLASGILTGKYNKGIPEDSRFAKQKQYMFIYEEYLGEANREKTIKTLTGLAEIAKKLDCKQAQLALAWCIKSKDVTTMILGASRVSQLKENLACLKIAEQLTPEILAEIETILGNKPKQNLCYRTMKPLADRR